MNRFIFVFSKSNQIIVNSYETWSIINKNRYVNIFSFVYHVYSLGTYKPYIDQ